MSAMLAWELVVLGIVLGLDGVAVGQTMLSRPMPAAMLAGLLVGHPIPAIAVGVLLECIALETLPVGASRYPEWAGGGVTAGAIAALLPDRAPGAIPAALLAALVIAWIGGRSLVVMRHWNGHRLAAARSELDTGSAGALGRLIAYGITADIVRGALVMGVGLLFIPAAQFAVTRWIPDGPTTTVIAVAIAAMVAAGATRQMFHAATGARVAFAAALGVGVLWVVVR
jgi:PTS system mannose-specific IIC component